MENKEKKRKREYLEGYERAVRQMERSDEALQELRAGKIYPAMKMSGMPHMPIHSDLSGYAAMLERLEGKYISDRYHRVMLCHEIVTQIERMENEDEKDVLMYRYIKLMSWNEIEKKMNYGIAQIYRIHTRALENFVLPDAGA